MDDFKNCEWKPLPGLAAVDDFWFPLEILKDLLLETGTPKLNPVQSGKTLNMTVQHAIFKVNLQQVNICKWKIGNHEIW